MKLICVYLLFAGVSFTAYGQSTSNQTKNANLPFTLALGFNQDAHNPEDAAARTVKAGSSITLRILKTNISDHDIPKAPIPSLPIGVFDVRDSDGHPVPLRKRTDKWFRTGGPGMAPGKNMMLQPGESIIDYTPVSNWYDLSQPGTYTIQVSQHVSNDPASEAVESNIIKITVVPPDPPAGEPK